MGSPASRLDIPEHLRPWYDLGLEYVLRPEGEQCDAPVQQDKDSAPQPVRQNTTPSQQAQPRQQQAQQCRPTSAPPVEGTPFPAPWDRFEKMAPAGARVMITYAELGHDLTGNADPARGQLMRNLLGYLKWPKGTAMFWPCSLPCEGRLVPQTRMFWAGAQRFACPTILCFGSEAMRVIYPQIQPGQDIIMLEQSSIHLLPSVGELLGKLPHEQQLAVASLAKLSI